VCQPAQQQQQQQQQLQPAATLHKSPSEVWAVGAGVLPASGGSGVAGALRAPAACRPSAAQLQCASSSPFAAGGGGQVPGAAAQYAVGLTKACMSHPCFADMVAEGSGLSPVGEVLLVPDLAAAVAVPWCPAGSGMAPVDMLEKGGQGGGSSLCLMCTQNTRARARAGTHRTHPQATQGMHVRHLVVLPCCWWLPPHTPHAPRTPQTAHTTPPRRAVGLLPPLCPQARAGPAGGAAWAHSSGGL
jgi:hypothetical protein